MLNSSQSHSLQNLIARVHAVAQHAVAQQKLLVYDLVKNVRCCALESSVFADFIGQSHNEVAHRLTRTDLSLPFFFV